MIDRRLLPANSRVAAEHLRGQVEAEAFVKGEVKQVTVPLVDLLRSPNGPRDRQLLLGQQVTEFEAMDGISFIQSHRDEYVGYVPSSALSTVAEPTHWVSVRASHAYLKADLKSPDKAALSFGSMVAVEDTAGAFSKTHLGWVPTGHLSPIDHVERDPVAIAELFLGTPYLWGGNSSAGIDCSGLVQAALLAAGLSCPGDSDLQEAALGRALQATEGHQRGDLLFWKGHVAIIVDNQRLIHANGHHMAVVYEGITEAIERIAAQGDQVTSRRRLISA